MNASPFAVPAAAGVLRLAAVGVADPGLDGGSRSGRAAMRVDASLGISNTLGLRLSLPLVSSGKSVAAGSAIGALSVTYAFRLGSIVARPVIELGASLPAAATSWEPSPALPVARDRLDLVAAGSLILAHGSGFAVVPWLSAGRGVGADLAFATPTFPLSLRAGVEVATWVASPVAVVAGAGLRFSEGAEVVAFGAVPVRGDASGTVGPLVGMGVRFEGSFVPSRPYAPPKGDVWRITRREFPSSGLAGLAVPSKVTLVELGAAWCESCHVAEPALTELANEEPRLAVRLVDVDHVPDAMTAVGGRSIPVFLLLSADGREIGRTVGWNETAVRALVADGLRALKN